MAAQQLWAAMLGMLRTQSRPFASQRAACMRRRSSASKSLRTPAGNPMPHTIARNAGMRQYIIRNSIVVFFVAFVAGVFVPRGSWAAIAYVQSANNYSAGAVTTLSKAFNSNNTAGNFIIVWAFWQVSGEKNLTWSVADSAGNA